MAMKYWWLILIALMIATPWLIHEIVNAMDGCYPWSPKEVPFHQGMTICPGQTAIFSGHHYYGHENTSNRPMRDVFHWFLP